MNNGTLVTADVVAPEGWSRPILNILSENKRLKRNEYMKNYMRQYRAKKKLGTGDVTHIPVITPLVPITSNILADHITPVRAIDTTAVIINPPAVRVWGE